MRLGLHISLLDFAGGAGVGDYCLLDFVYVL